MDFSKELALSIEKGVEKSIFNPNLMDSCLNGNQEAMVKVGYACLEEATNCSELESERKRNLVEVGLFWLNESILQDCVHIDDLNDPDYDMDDCFWDLYDQKWNVACAYTYLASAYHQILPKDGLRGDLLKNVIPENKQKAFYYREAGAEYSELCAIELVLAYLEGELVEENIDKAYVVFKKVLKTTKNTPRCEWSALKPNFIWCFRDYEIHNQVAHIFFEKQAYTYAFEIWNELFEIVDQDIWSVLYEITENDFDKPPCDAWKIPYNLSYCFLNGIGTTRDSSRGYFLFDKARILYSLCNYEESFKDMDKKNYCLQKRI